jgi:hypothetical protein
MLNRRLADHDRDSRQTSTDIIDPIVLAKRSQALSYRFIKRIGRNLDDVLNPLSSQQHTLQVRRPTVNENNSFALSSPSIRAHMG